MQLQDDKYHHRHQRNRLTAWFLFITNNKDYAFKLSLLFNLVFVMTWMLPMIRHYYYFGDTSMMIRGDERVWHGGHPMAQDHKGSCWCGAEDGYCMCTPNVAIDLILVPQTQQQQQQQEPYVWLVRRKDTNQLATMGGFVDVGETVEEAVHRELKEEMGIVLWQDESQQQSQEPLQLLGVYSDPKRDNRRRNVSVVFVVHLQHAIQPKAADDAKDVQMIALSHIEEHDFFADHKTILLDYRHSLQHQNENKKGGSTATVDDILASKRGDPSLQAALAIQRSVCKSL